MIFNYTHSQNSYATNLHINNIPLTQVGTNFQEQTIKFLGIYIDEKLSWKRHISQICSKMARSIFFINKVKNILPTSALKILYYSLVHCHIIYGIMVWGGAQTINKIFILQKRAIRTICKRKYRDHTEPLFKKENILKINDVFKLHVNLFMYDYRQNHLPESFSNFFPNNLQRNPDNSRRPNTCYCERPRTKFTSTLPKHNFPKMWNNTVANIKELEITSRQQFKTAMIKNLLQSYQN